MKVYFGTNRAPNRRRNPDGFTRDPNPVSPGELRFGHILAARDGTAIEDIEIYPEAKTRGVLTARTDFFTEIRDTMAREGRDLLIYVHGYDYSFEEAVLRTSAIVALYEAAGARLVPFVFTWPSDGRKLPFRSYYRDRDDARNSALALSRGFQKLAERLEALWRQEQDRRRQGGADGESLLCDQQIHVMAHSMGNFAFAHALARMADEGARPRRIWGEVILAAADEDEDVFEPGKRLESLTHFCRRVTCYIDRDDVALKISDVTKTNPDRLGAQGPVRPRSLPPQIEVVDCEPVTRAKRDISRHQYYYKEQAVIADIVAVLSGLPADDIAGRRYQAQKNHYRLGG